MDKEREERMEGEGEPCGVNMYSHQSVGKAIFDSRVLVTIRSDKRAFVSFLVQSLLQHECLQAIHGSQRCQTPVSCINFRVYTVQPLV